MTRRNPTVLSPCAHVRKVSRSRSACSSVSRNSAPTNPEPAPAMRDKSASFSRPLRSSMALISVIGSLNGLNPRFRPRSLDDLQQLREDLRTAADDAALIEVIRFASEIAHQAARLEDEQRAGRHVPG